MSKSISPLKKQFICGLVVLFAVQSTVLANVAESHFWAERRRARMAESATLQSSPLASLNMLSNSILPRFSDSEEGSLRSIPGAINHSITSPTSLSDLERDVRTQLSQFGFVKAMQQPQGKPVRGVVVHVQDVHGHDEAQKNIKNAIAALSAINKIDFVGLEGSWDPIAVDHYRDFPAPESLDRAVQMMVNDRRISGAAAAVLAHRERIMGSAGIDDARHHKRNVESYLLSIENNSRVEQVLQKWTSDLEVEKSRELSRLLFEFDQRTNQLRSGQLSLADFLESLTGIFHLKMISHRRRWNHFVQYRHPGESRDPGLKPSVKGRFTNWIPAFAGMTSSPTESFQKNFIRDGFSSKFVDQVNLYLEALALERKLSLDQVKKEQTLFFSSLMQNKNRTLGKQLLEKSALLKKGFLADDDYFSALLTLASQGEIRLTSTPSWHGYIQYRLLVSQLRFDKLLDQVKEIQEQVYASLICSDREKELIAEGQYLELLKKLVRFELTRQEWNDYKRFKVGNANKNVFDVNMFENFYREAEIRDDLLSQNFLKRVEGGASSPSPLLHGVEERDSQKLSAHAPNNIDSSAGSKSPLVGVSVLVAGGFHSAAVERNLVSEGYAVLTFSPKVSSVERDGHLEALNLFAQKKAPLEQLFDGKALFLASDSAPPAAQIDLVAAASIDAWAQDPTVEPHLRVWFARFLLSLSARLLKWNGFHQSAADVLMSYRLQVGQKRMNVQHISSSPQKKGLKNLNTVVLASMGPLLFVDPHAMMAVLRSPWGPYMFTPGLVVAVAGFILFVGFRAFMKRQKARGRSVVKLESLQTIVAFPLLIGLFMVTEGRHPFGQPDPLEGVAPPLTISPDKFDNLNDTSKVSQIKTNKDSIRPWDRQDPPGMTSWFWSLMKIKKGRSLSREDAARRAHHEEWVYSGFLWIPYLVIPVINYALGVHLSWVLVFAANVGLFILINVLFGLQHEELSVWNHARTTLHSRKATLVDQLGTFAPLGARFRNRFLLAAVGATFMPINPLTTTLLLSWLMVSTLTAFSRHWTHNHRGAGPVASRRRGMTVNPLASLNDSEQMWTVNPWSYAVSDPRSQFTQLKSFGAFSCVIITLYIPQNKRGLLAHFDAVQADSVESFDELLDALKLKSHELENLQVNIFCTATRAGRNTAANGRINIQKVLAKKGISGIKIDINSDGRERGIVLDVLDGRIYELRNLGVFSQNLKFFDDLRTYVRGFLQNRKPLFPVGLTRQDPPPYRDTNLLALFSAIGAEIPLLPPQTSAAHWVMPLTLPYAARQRLKFLGVPLRLDDEDRVSLVFEGHKARLIVTQNIRAHDIPGREYEDESSNQIYTVFMHLNWGDENPERRFDEAELFWGREFTVKGQPVSAFFSHSRRPMLGQWVHSIGHTFDVNDTTSVRLSESIRTKPGEVVWDLMTGSGVSAIRSALQGAQHVIASDISDEALAVANFNAAAIHVLDRVRVVKANVFEGVPEDLQNLKVDRITANPPMLGQASEDVMVSDPTMSILDRLLTQAHRVLKPSGVIEISYYEVAQFFERVYQHGWQPVVVEGTNQSRRDTDTPTVNIFVSRTTLQRQDPKRAEEYESLLDDWKVVAEFERKLFNAQMPHRDLIDAVQDVRTRRLREETFGAALLVKSASELLSIVGRRGLVATIPDIRIDPQSAYAQSIEGGTPWTQISGWENFPPPPSILRRPPSGGKADSQSSPTMLSLIMLSVLDPMGFESLALLGLLIPSVFGAKSFFNYFWSLVGRLMAFGVLIAFLPVFFVIALLVQVGSPGPVFFVQERVGQYGKPIYVWKFRTLTTEPDRRDRHITWFGSWARFCAIDELPQLINIIKGDMAWYGPRPTVDELLTDEYRPVYVAVKPGIYSTSVYERGFGKTTAVTAVDIQHDNADRTLSVWGRTQLAFKINVKVMFGVLSKVRQLIRGDKQSQQRKHSDDVSTVNEILGQPEFFGLDSVNNRGRLLSDLSDPQITQLAQRLQQRLFASQQMAVEGYKRIQNILFEREVHLNLGEMASAGALGAVIGNKNLQLPLYNVNLESSLMVRQLLKDMKSPGQRLVVFVNSEDDRSTLLFHVQSLPHLEVIVSSSRGLALFDGNQMRVDVLKQLQPVDALANSANWMGVRQPGTTYQYHPQLEHILASIGIDWMEMSAKGWVVVPLRSLSTLLKVSRLIYEAA